jgi:hypothetical protein
MGDHEFLDHVMSNVVVYNLQGGVGYKRQPYVCVYIYIYMHTHTTVVHKVPRLSLLKRLLEHFFLELPYIYLSRDIKLVSEFYEQRHRHTHTQRRAEMYTHPSFFFVCPAIRQDGSGTHATSTIS